MDDHLSHPGTDRRAKGAVRLIDGGTPLPESSVVYFAHEKGSGEDQWRHITSQENLAAVQANSEQFKLMTVFTVPVADLARAPIAHLVRARTMLDQIERRTAAVERRVDDRHPGEPLTWEGEFDVLAMKAAFNDMQAEVERAQKSSLNFMQIRTDLGAEALRYIKYLADLAGKTQAGRCRAQGGDTNKEAAGAASHSQAVPSELASLQRYQPHARLINAMQRSEQGNYVRFADVQSLFSHSAATGKAEAVAAMNRAKALKAWDCIPHALHVELDTIFKYLASPAAPLAGKAEDDTRNAFEAWYMENFTSNRVYLTRMAGGERQGEYYDSDTQNIWLAWQAGAGHAAPLPAAVPAEEASDVQKDIESIADELEDAAAPYGGDFADTVSGCAEALRQIAGRVSAVPAIGCGGSGKCGVGDLPCLGCDNCPETPAEPAPILASALTDGRILSIAEETAINYVTDERHPDNATIIDFAREIEKECARLPKPTAQGTAHSIDTPEFRELLESAWVASPLAPSGKKSARDRAFDTLIAHINRHIAAQAPAGRDAALEEAAKEAEKCFVSIGQPDDPHPDAVTFNGAVYDCARAIRALKSHAAEPTSGGAK